MLKRILLYTFLTLYIAAVPCVFAQEKSDDDKKKEAEKSQADVTAAAQEEEKTALQSSVEQVLAVSAASLHHSFEDKDQVDIRINLNSSMALAFRTYDDIPPSLTLSFPRAKSLPVISTTYRLLNIYQTFPSLEGIVTPRTSMNIDPITGKYYWEW